jgi:hypothetical protein
MEEFKEKAPHALRVFQNVRSELQVYRGPPPRRTWHQTALALAACASAPSAAHPDEDAAATISAMHGNSPAQLQALRS